MERVQAALRAALAQEGAALESIEQAVAEFRERARAPGSRRGRLAVDIEEIAVTTVGAPPRVLSSAPFDGYSLNGRSQITALEEGKLANWADEESRQKAVSSGIRSDDADLERRIGWARRLFRMRLRNWSLEAARRRLSVDTMLSLCWLDAASLRPPVEAPPGYGAAWLESARLALDRLPSWRSAARPRGFYGPRRDQVRFLCDSARAWLDARGGGAKSPPSVQDPHRSGWAFLESLVGAPAEHDARLQDLIDVLAGTRHAVGHDTFARRFDQDIRRPFLSIFDQERNRILQVWAAAAPPGATRVVLGVSLAGLGAGLSAGARTAAAAAGGVAVGGAAAGSGASGAAMGLAGLGSLAVLLLVLTDRCRDEGAGGARQADASASVALLGQPPPAGPPGDLASGGVRPLGDEASGAAGVGTSKPAASQRAEAGSQSDVDRPSVTNAPAGVTTLPAAIDRWDPDAGWRAVSYGDSRTQRRFTPVGDGGNLWCTGLPRGEGPGISAVNCLPTEADCTQRRSSYSTSVGCFPIGVATEWVPAIRCEDISIDPVEEAGVARAGWAPSESRFEASRAVEAAVARGCRVVGASCRVENPSEAWGIVEANVVLPGAAPVWSHSTMHPSTRSWSASVNVSPWSRRGGTGKADGRWNPGSFLEVIAPKESIDRRFWTVLCAAGEAARPQTMLLQVWPDYGGEHSGPTQEFPFEISGLPLDLANLELTGPPPPPQNLQ
jgi:hypothetical protein